MSHHLVLKTYLRTDSNEPGLILLDRLNASTAKSERSARFFGLKACREIHYVEDYCMIVN